MGEPGVVPGRALGDVAYLARSENRVRILTALATGPHDRSELEETAGVARTTLGRVLGELEDRGWVERTSDGGYVATPTGELVVGEFVPLLEAMETIGALGDVAAWLPVEELSIGLGHFRDATVRRSTAHEPLGLVEYLAELVREASTFRVMTFLAPPSPVGEAIQEKVLEGELTMEGVLAGGLVEHLGDEDHQPPDWRESLEAGGRIYRYDGHVPCNLFVLDETALVVNDRPPGNTAAVESDDETVRAELNRLYETYRAEAERVDAEYFA